MQIFNRFERVDASRKIIINSISFFNILILMIFGEGNLINDCKLTYTYILTILTLLLLEIVTVSQQES